MVNEEVHQRLPGKEKLYTNMDEVKCENGEDISNYSTDFLNSLTPSKIPSHKLNLKISEIVMLLRNLDVNQVYAIELCSLCDVYKFTQLIVKWRLDPTKNFGFSYKKLRWYRPIHFCF
jgi:hypothetical protein